VRGDDNPEVFKTRLDVYRAQTSPVTEYYRSQGLLNIVDGLQPIDAVTEELSAALAALPSHQIRSDCQMKPFTFQAPPNVLFEGGASKKLAELVGGVWCKARPAGHRQGCTQRRADEECRGGPGRGQVRTHGIR